MKMCGHCGKEFEPAWNKPHQRYCCHECGIKAWRTVHPGCTAKWSKAKREACPEKARAATNRYAAKHPEKAKERGRKHYESHKDEVLARTKEWHKNNLEKTRISSRKSSKKWRQNNPEKARLSYMQSAHKRKALKLQAGGSFTAQEFLDLCKAHHWRCAYCGCELTTRTATVDHKIPLSKGGGSGIENIAPACQLCNSSKHTRTAKEYKAPLELCLT